MFIIILWGLMNGLRVVSVGEYQCELMGYTLVGNKVVYLTESELCVMRVGIRPKKETVKIKGMSILNFVISKRGYIAFLMKNKTVEVRRMDNLSQVFHKFTNILIFPQQNYPKMKWDYQQLYLVYADSLEILDLKSKERKGYTDIIDENEQINDIVITNVMEEGKAAILQLNHRLIFTVIPIPITELPFQSVNSMLTLYSPSLSNDSKREYLAILSNNRQLTVLNMLNLKRVTEIDLNPTPNQFLQMQADPNCQCILVRYISKVSLEITKNVIYKINSEEYYSQCEDYFQQPSSLFFRYKFQLSVTENLTLFPLSFQVYDDDLFDYYSLIFFKQGRIYSALQAIPHNYSQSMSELRGKRCGQCQQDEQWRKLIQAYFSVYLRRESSMYQQQRQLHEYNMIKGEFDTILSKFSERINQQTKRGDLTEEIIQQQWDQYMAQIAKERNFMIETMKLFKIQSQIIRKKTEIQPTQMEKCINDMENREKRIDARIQEKKKEIQLEKIEKSKSSKEEIQKYQEDYEKFVAEFMQETEKKEREEREREKQKGKVLSNEIDEKFILALPHLTEQQRRIINLNTNVTQPQPQPQQNPYQRQTQQILLALQQKLNPFLSHLNPLIDRLSALQVSCLEDIKRNQAQVLKRCSVNLQQIVKNACKRTLLTLSTRIKNRIELTSRSIYELQDRNRKYYQQSIQQFKKYVKFNIIGRVQVFYRGRKRLEGSLLRERAKATEDVAKELVRE